MQIILSAQPSKLVILQRSIFFSGFSTEDLESLANSSIVKHFERGEIIFWEHEPCSGFHIVIRGCVKLFKIAPNGRELILRALSDGESFNEVPIFDEGTNPVSSAALEESELLIIQSNDLRKMIKNKPELAGLIVVKLAHILRNMVGLVEEFAFFQVTNRLARLLFNLNETDLVGNQENRLTQDDLAARLGTVREVVARSLRELEQAGVIQVHRGEIKILERAKLREWGKIHL